MTSISDFDNLRPYTDSEIPQALRLVASHPHLPTFARMLHADPAALRRQLLAVNSRKQLLIEVMRPLFINIMQASVSHFVASGASHLQPNTPYLFISNHRDIVLDAYFLMLYLHQNNCIIPQVTFGENLMRNPLFLHLGRACGMFRVPRGGTPREFYRQLSLLSQYIHFTINHVSDSVWIAQRNGRTKNGLDLTDPALLKMLSLSTPSLNPAAALASLRIVPVAVSYQWEPCDILKCRELLAPQPYRKSAHEDLNSIISGIRSQKGTVSLSVTPPLTLSDLQPLNPSSRSFFRSAANLIDSRIRSAYALSPNNLIAYALLHHSDPAAVAPPSEISAFLHHLKNLPQPLQHQLLSLYANPCEPLPSFFD